MFGVEQFSIFKALRYVRGRTFAEFNFASQIFLFFRNVRGRTFQYSCGFEAWTGPKIHSNSHIHTNGAVHNSLEQFPDTFISLIFGLAVFISHMIYKRRKEWEVSHPLGTKGTLMCNRTGCTRALPRNHSVEDLWRWHTSYDSFFNNGLYPCEFSFVGV